MYTLNIWILKAHAFNMYWDLLQLDARITVNFNFEQVISYIELFKYLLEQVNLIKIFLFCCCSDMFNWINCNQSLFLYCVITFHVALTPRCISDRMRVNVLFVQHHFEIDFILLFFLKSLWELSLGNLCEIETFKFNDQSMHDYHK